MKQKLKALDAPILLFTLMLVAMGILTLYSAGRGGGPNQASIWIRQSVWFLMGFTLMTFVANQNPQKLFRASFILYILGILSLAAVFLVGKKLGAGAGAQRWIVILGMTFQPSELAKWLTLLFVSQHLGTKSPDRIGYMEIIGTSALVFFPMLLVMKQPDLGMAVSFLPILIIIPIMNGLKKRWIALGLVACTGLGFAAWHKVLKPYQKQRILTFLDPDADLKGKGYQINQSRIAIGAGGILGQGFTAGSQTQLNFLPVKTTDFVFSVWAEERGFIGVLLALGLFGALLSRILDIARNSKQLNETVFCVGTASILGLHLMVNVGMVVGVLPNKGMVLPFFSAGGSSTLSYFLGLGVVMAVAHKAKIK